MKIPLFTPRSTTEGSAAIVVCRWSKGRVLRQGRGKGGREGGMPENTDHIDTPDTKPGGLRFEEKSPLGVLILMS